MYRRLAPAVVILLAGLAPAYAAATGYEPFAVVTWYCPGDGTCRFDGSGSWDPEEGPLTYVWRVVDPDAACASVSATGETADLCLGPHPRQVELVVTDVEGLTGRWNATVSPFGILLGVRPAACHGLRCYFEVDVTSSNYADVTINATGEEQWFCSAQSTYADREWAECGHHVFFPANGTYHLRLRADDHLGNVTEHSFAVTVANRPPILHFWVDCRDGSLRCGAWAYGYDEDEWNWTLNITWEPEPGVFVQGDTVDWLFSRPGIHRVRVWTEDAHGWRQSGQQILSLRNHVWAALAVLPAGGPVALTSDGGTVYLLDASKAGDPANRIQRTWIGADQGPQTVASLNIRVRDAAFAATGPGVHVLGGDAGNGPTQLHQVLDAQSGVWRNGPDLPVALKGAAAAAAYAEFWLLGGHTPSGPSASTFRLEEGAWIPGPDLPWNGTVHATHVDGTLFVAGQRDGVWELARHRIDPPSETGTPREWWELLAPPPEGLGMVRGIAAFDRRIWLLQEGDPGALLSLDLYPIFLEEPAWDPPIPVPEPLGALTRTWDGVWGSSLHARPDGTRGLHVFGPPRSPIQVRFFLPALVHESEGGALLARVDAPAGVDFEELLEVTVQPAGSRPLGPGEYVSLLPGQEVARHNLPGLAAGRYEAQVTAHGVRESRLFPFEVVTVWA